MSLTAELTAQLTDLRTAVVWGRVASIEQTTLRVAGLNAIASIGDGVAIETVSPEGSPTTIEGEIVAFNKDTCVVYAFDRLTGVRLGDRARTQNISFAKPSDKWLGCLIDPRGRTSRGAPAPEGPRRRRLDSSAPPATLRRGFGERLSSGLNAFDTFLPICRGQRIGLFAAPGVGKSSLIADLATRAQADVVVVALIGERGREVRAFFEHALTPEVRERTVLVAASSDQTAPLKRRAAMMAMTAAEHFRDQGKHVLLLFDSLTRFADSHREIALAGGEPPSLRAYPPSTFQMLASLVERAGTGVDEEHQDIAMGDITAVFSVLAAGGDMDEPISDAVRGFLDGHVILDRNIAERGRFPAIDILRSASRSLPGAATPDQNVILQEARTLLGAYRDGEIMVKAGLYESGADPLLDRAVLTFNDIDQFIAGKSETPETAFDLLDRLTRGLGPESKEADPAMPASAP